MADKPISGLPALPGNLDLNALLAVVQGGITYHTEAQKLTASGYDFGTYANGLWVRLHGPRIQICTYLQPTAVAIDEGTAPNIRSASQRWDYPQAFSDLPVVVPGVYIGIGHASGVRMDGLDTVGINYRLYSTVAGTTARAMLIAIGQY